MEISIRICRKWTANNLGVKKRHSYKRAYIEKDYFKSKYFLLFFVIPGSEFKNLKSLAFSFWRVSTNEPINVKIAQSESALQPELNDLQIIIENVFNFLNIISKNSFKYWKFCLYNYFYHHSSAGSVAPVKRN